MRFIALIAAFSLFTGCYDSSFGNRGEGKAPNPTTTIGHLHSLYAGQTVIVNSDMRVAGYVTTSDREENFYKTLCIESDGAALEIMAGIDHLHNDYPIGTYVVADLKGLALGMSYGVLQIGRMPEPGSGFATDYIASRPALDKTLYRRGEQAPISPALRTITNLTPEFCGTLVRIEGLHYTPEDMTPGSWSGYKRFTDDTGAVIRTYVRNYATFATHSVPVQRVSLTGILQKDGSAPDRYILKLRDENDCTAE